MLETPTIDGRVENTPQDRVFCFSYTRVTESIPVKYSQTDQTCVVEFSVPDDYDYQFATDVRTHFNVEEDIATEFGALAESWRAGRGILSSAQQMALHPDYVRIVELGESVVPLILEDLRESADHWFVALHAITGVNPVPEESRGRLRDMADAWVTWGKKKGYI